MEDSSNFGFYKEKSPQPKPVRRVRKVYKVRKCDGATEYSYSTVLVEYVTNFKILTRYCTGYPHGFINLFAPVLLYGTQSTVQGVHASTGT